MSNWRMSSPSLMQYYGRVIRSDDKNLQKKNLERATEGKHGRGRPS